MIFIIILIITALSIAGTAAYFSIIGLAAIFSGIFVSIIIMGAVLEVGKLVAASYAYRYWEILPFQMKGYLVSSVFVLMIITSAGIFGMLSVGHQRDVLPLKQQEQQIELLNQEKEEIETLRQERLERRKQIDKDIASLPNDYVTGRQRLMESYGPELEQIRNDINEYVKRTREITNELNGMKIKTLEQRTHVGPIIFISQVFNVDIETATKWIILLIIFVFDPLAVVLTIGANIAIMERQGGKKAFFKRLINKREPEVETEPEVEEEENKHIAHDIIQINSGMSIEDLERVLDERFDKNALSPEQQLQRALIEEMVARKKVTQKIRKPN